MIVTVRNDLSDNSANKSMTWAIQILKEALSHQHLALSENGEFPSSESDVHCIRLIRSVKSSHGDEDESFRITSTEKDGLHMLEISAGGTQGYLYALLELADRLRYADDPERALSEFDGMEERTGTKVRSINRLFVSETEDKPWFYDREFWQSYLTELATHRFNRLHLALGMGYDYGHDPGVKDNYFCFAYPFLIDVPGYSVRVKGLPDGEAERNLDMLRYIGEAAKLRGIHFQLGLWTHAYDPSDSPQANYVIEGLDPSNHAAYCRDAVRTLLQACPSIDGITFRIHYESGIPEPAHTFWIEVFKGVAEAGRPLELDLHPKGADEGLVQAAVDTGLPVSVSPKFWAEHMGLPYHQAAIREKELPTDHTDRPDLMALTATSRRFTRYGYADFLKEGREYGVFYRVWPGTQRVLLWGDPVMAASYARSAKFSGSQGLELCEPLTFKGRKGSGSPGGREPYSDPALQMNGQEWRKYRYWYRLWGRALYNPDADDGARQRYLNAEFGEAGDACGRALALASRILPLITTAHLPSAANNVYWPEMYTNMPIIRTEETFYDFDTLPPHTFNSVSPLDPEMFYSIDDYAAALVEGSVNGKITPLETCAILTNWAEGALAQLSEAASRIPDARSSEFRRWKADIEMMAGLGTFFARKLAAGCGYALYLRTGKSEQLAEALAQYRLARKAWENLVRSSEVYASDITFGYVPHMRGHWADRLPAIEKDLEAMERLYRSGYSTAEATAPNRTERPTFPATGWAHERPAPYRPGDSVHVELTQKEDITLKVVMHYRHANQAESYQSVVMISDGRRHTAEIPGTYTDSPYPLIYYFEVINDKGDASLIPGFDGDFANQPYYLLRQSL